MGDYKYPISEVLDNTRLFILPEILGLVNEFSQLNVYMTSMQVRIIIMMVQMKKLKTISTLILSVIKCKKVRISLISKSNFKIQKKLKPISMQVLI